MIALPPFWQLVALLATHWVGDFVLQTNFQASNKNKRLDALSLHVATYTATLFVAAVILFGLMPAITFAVVNAALHFVTDYITSRISSKLWAKRDWHRFFVTIGFDQLIHQATWRSRCGSWWRDEWATPFGMEHPLDKHRHKKNLKRPTARGLGSS